MATWPSRWRPSSRWSAVGSSTLLAVVSWGVALAHVAGNDWFDAHDLGLFAMWCLLAGALAYPAIRRFQRQTARAGAALLLGVASAAGIAFGIAWTFLVTLILGDWIAGFGFPVLLCWVAGSVFGFLASTVLERPRLWPAASSLALAIPVSAGAVLAWLSAAPLDAVVYFKPGTTRDHVEYVWNELFATPTGRGSGGVRSISAADDLDRPGIRLSFQPRTSKERRAIILAGARSLPFVDEIIDARRPTRAEVEEWLRKPVDVDTAAVQR